MSAPREYPILFSGPMVRALLDGTKTMTRRVVTAKVWDEDEDGKRRPYTTTPGVWGDGREMTAAEVAERFRCPYGQPGDRLWVRETWQYADWTEDGEPFVRYAADDTVRFCEGADEGERLVEVWAELSATANYAIDNKAADRRWRPSIFMPRWASRITLELTDVRVQRVQEISLEDCWAEGVPQWTAARGALADPPFDPRNGFIRLWDTINAKRGYGWDANPFVWALTFRRITP